LLGIALMSSGRREDATVHFKKALEADPRFHPALKNLAVNELAMGRNKDARAHFEQAARLVPQDAVVNFHLGQIYSAEGRYREAAAFFESAQTGFPDPYQVGFNLALARVNSKDYGAAVRAGERMLVQGYRKAELYNLLSRAYAESGRTQEAYEALRTATKIDPRDETNYLDLMLLCLEHENWDLSLEISGIALEMIPGAYKVRLQRGAVFALKGQLDEAEREFLAATQAAPAVNLPYVALALVKIETNKLAEATDVLRTRRALDPKDYLVNWILAEAIAKEETQPGSAPEREAVQALEDAVRVNPGVSQPRALLASLLVKRGDLARATREFEAALRLDPDDAASAYQLALLYRKTGAAKRAEELFAKVGKARAEDPARSAPRNLVRIIREGSQ
ncbi:MAG: tetratricopeptide repeat protein, partial [Blastocatellia bacterium]